MTEIIRVASIYDRDWNDCYVVKHPDPDLHEEWVAVFNHKTGQFKLNDDGKVKRYWGKSISGAGYDASDDSAWFREVPELAHLRLYGDYVPDGEE